MTQTGDEMSGDGTDSLCEIMHDAYEAAAAGSGWVTNPASRKPWADVPEANKAATWAAVSALVAAVRAQIAAEILADKFAEVRVPSNLTWNMALESAACVARGGQHGK
jgi:hypothetical protein